MEPKEVAERYINFKMKFLKLLLVKEREEVEIDDVRFIAHALLEHRSAVRMLLE